MIKVLPEFNADVDTRDVEGRTPLHFASHGYYLGGRITAPSLSNVARLLLEHGADVNAQDNEGVTPLHVAALYGRIEVVRTLLEHGANVRAKENHGKTAFHIASDDDIRKLLSEHVR
jgi:ankyrin repeat protein